MISISGDEVTEHQVQFGVSQFNSDLTTRTIEFDSKEEAEQIARTMGGSVVARNVYFGTWSNAFYAE